jgi:hypothetical protein
MKVYILSAGDKTVGIPNYCKILDIQEETMQELEEMFALGIRETLRKDIQNLYSTYFVNGFCLVRFEDECPDCGQKLTVISKGFFGDVQYDNCHNSNCINNCNEN